MESITMRYLGGRPGYVLGSIVGGTSTLTLPEGHGFLAGDRVIVETGGEAAGGALGTVGVGGVFPANSFATMAELEASGPPGWVTVDGDPMAYARDTGETRWWDQDGETGSWEPNDGFVYINKAIPLALIATVDAVSGNVLTLDTNATVSTTGARVWCDCSNALEQAVRTPGSRLRIEGNAEAYAIGRFINNQSFGFDDVEVWGDGMGDAELVSPKGCPNLRIYLTQVSDVLFRDMTLRRLWTENAIYVGYDGSVWAGEPPLKLATGDRLKAIRVRSIDGVFCDLNIASSTGAEIRECEVIRHVVARRYVGWAMQLADCTDGGIYDSTIDADYRVEAFEIFKGGGGVGIYNCGGRNGHLTFNSANRPMVDGFNMIWEAGAGGIRLAADPTNIGNSYFIGHSNQFSNPDAEGGNVRNARFELLGAWGSPYGGGYTHHNLLPAAGDPFTLGPNVEIYTGGFGRAIVEETGGDTQDVILDGVITDDTVHVRHGSISNTTAPVIEYCSDHATLGSGNVSPLITDVCA